MTVKNFVVASIVSIIVLLTKQYYFTTYDQLDISQGLMLGFEAVIIKLGIKGLVEHFLETYDINFKLKTLMFGDGKFAQNNVPSAKLSSISYMDNNDRGRGSGSGSGRGSGTSSGSASGSGSANNASNVGSSNVNQASSPAPARPAVVTNLLNSLTLDVNRKITEFRQTVAFFDQLSGSINTLERQDPNHTSLDLLERRHEQALTECQNKLREIRAVEARIRLLNNQYQSFPIHEFEIP